MRLEQFAAQGCADERVAHRPGARFRVALEAPHEERTLVGRELVVDESGDLIVDLFGHGRRAPLNWAYSNGASALSIASRARKMRERTVPTGHSMVCAISS